MNAVKDSAAVLELGVGQGNCDKALRLIIPRRERAQLVARGAGPVAEEETFEEG